MHGIHHVAHRLCSSCCHVLTSFDGHDTGGLFITLFKSGITPLVFPLFSSRLLRQVVKTEVIDDDDEYPLHLPCRFAFIHRRLSFSLFDTQPHLGAIRGESLFI